MSVSCVPRTKGLLCNVSRNSKGDSLTGGARRLRVLELESACPSISLGNCPLSADRENPNIARSRKIHAPKEEDRYR